MVLSLGILQVGTKKMKTKCEVYSRCCGYIRPVNQWNNGKQEEYHKRLQTDVKSIDL